jgi:hypothetical protein
MSQQALDLIVILGMALLIAIQGYILITLGRAMAQPEKRQMVGSQLVLTGISLVLIALLAGIAAVILIIMNRL